MTDHLRRPLCLFFFLGLHVTTGILYAQDATARRRASFSAGMGVSYIRASDVVDYVNQVISPDKLDDFASAVEFFAAPEISLNADLSLKFEYAYLLKTYSVSGQGAGLFSFDYAVHMPTVVLVYVLEGEGFYVKLGGGAGYHFGKFTQLFPNSASESRFTTGGIGFKLEAMGNTAFSESLYGLIGGDARLDFLGRLKDNAGKGLEIRRAFGPIDPVRLRFASVGIKFGLVYYF